MEKPNVFLLSADSLRYDYFSDFQGEIKRLTNGVSFTNAVSTATQTSSSMPTLATGAYTDEFESWGLPEAGSPEPLAEVFCDYDYSSGLWTDNFLFGVDYNYHRGFDGGDLGEPTWKKRLSMALQNGPTKAIFPIVEWVYFNAFKRFTQYLGGNENFYRTANSLNESAIKWLSEQEPPTFSWIHYMDTHHPFEPPSAYLDRCEFNTSRTRSELSQFTRNVIKENGRGYSIQARQDVERAYAASCEYQGDQILEFIHNLQEEGIYEPERDIFILTADHGECLSYEEYGMMGHVPPALWEEAIRVPLVISTPDWSRDTVTEQATLANLYDTIIAAVESQIEPSRRPAPTPEDMTTETAYFVTEWEVPGTDETHTYRGVRRKDGMKLFGGRIDNEDQIVLTEYDDEQMSDEILSMSKNGEPPNEPDLAEVWKEVINVAEENGPLLEDTATVQEQLDEDHLRDLGYLE